MANSIAKLAILLTADSSGLNSGMARAQSTVRGFHASMKGMGGKGLGGLGGLSNLMGGGGGGAWGNTAKILAIWVAASAKSAAILEQKMFDARLELQKAQIAAGTFQGTMLDAADTINGKFGGMRDELLALLAASTGDMPNVLADIANGIGDAAAAMTKLFGGQTAAEQKAAIERMNKLTEATKAQAAAYKKALEEEKKRMQGMRDHAASIVKSLRNPFEIFADTVNDLRGLSGLGLIDPETLTRGMDKAKKDLIAASKEAKKFRDMTAGPIAAAERFTAAGQSAVASGRAELMKLAELEKQQLAESKRQTDVIKEGFRTLAKKKPITLRQHSL